MTTKFQEFPSLHSLLDNIAKDGDCAGLIRNTADISSVILDRPFDTHLHLRDGDMLKQVAPLSASTFAGGIIMPNIKPVVESLDGVLRYRTEILKVLSDRKISNFIPNMTVNFKNYTREELESLNGVITGIKMYPKGQTTNSESGVNSEDIDSYESTFRAMQELGIPLLIHGEVVTSGDQVDILDKERKFIPTYEKLAQKYPELKIIMEHITTKEAVKTLNEYENLYATVTLQHLLVIHNHILEGGTHPHLMCMPIPKLMEDRKALLTEVLKGNPNIMFGSDSAPHTQENKESANGCCGCFTAPIALQALVEIFEYFGHLDKLQNFVSQNAQDIYGAKMQVIPDRFVELKRKGFIVPETYGEGENRVVPFLAGKELAWSTDTK